LPPRFRASSLFSLYWYQCFTGTEVRILTQLEEQLHALPPRRQRATAERHHKMLHAAHAHSKGIRQEKKKTKID
jgi:hypothetical protein